MAKRKKARKRITLSEEQTILSEERTILSKERTVLSFMQTGLAFIAVGLAVVNFLKDVPTQVVGWILILVGLFEIAESIRRLIRYRKKMDKLKRRLGGKSV
jgi:uncharacterized membrane protein YidH (DUF202 family)